MIDYPNADLWHKKISRTFYQSNFPHRESERCVEPFEAFLERIPAVKRDELDYGPKFSSLGQEVDMAVPGIEATNQI